jgi:serine protease Do
MESILKDGRVTRGFLGVALQPMTDELAQQFNLDPNTSGALVSEVQPGSPSEKAGVKNGDVVTAVNGKKIADARELQLMIGSLKPGAKVELTVLRDGKEQATSVELGERQDPRGIAKAEPANTDPDVLDGVQVADIDAEVRKQYEIPESVKGVAIIQVDPESPSAAAGLKPGDVIHEVARQPVATAKEAVDLSEKLKGEKKVLLRVSSRGGSRYVVVERK